MAASFYCLRRQVAQNRTKLCGPPKWPFFTRLQVSKWVNFSLWIFCIHCDGPKEVSSTQNKVREKGGKSATQLVLQWCCTACVEVWKDGVQCTTSCYALPPALLSLSPFVHFDLILCLDFILIIFIFGLISITFLKADNYARLYLKQADLIRLTPWYYVSGKKWIGWCFLNEFFLPWSFSFTFIN